MNFELSSSQIFCFFFNFFSNINSFWKISIFIRNQLKFSDLTISYRKIETLISALFYTGRGYIAGWGRNLYVPSLPCRTQHNLTPPPSPPTHHTLFAAVVKMQNILKNVVLIKMIKNGGVSKKIMSQKNCTSPPPPPSVGRIYYKIILSVRINMCNSFIVFWNVLRSF